MAQIKWEKIEAELCHSLGRSFKLGLPYTVDGGSINQAFWVDSNNGPFFIKVNEAHRLAMFEAEYDGLHEIGRTHTVKTPTPRVVGASDQHCFLVLDYLNLGHSRCATTDRRLGQQLAVMHRHTRTQFGWYQDNTIGTTRQPNPWCDCWLNFYRKYRLGFQLQLISQNDGLNQLLDKGNRLSAQLESFFTSYQPLPSLLHGDLWGGNISVDNQNQPVIYDPAIYYGDREADIAMTELFGDFGADFYAAYNDVWPLDPGYSQRKTLYNLYHVLNHFNLFSGHYASQAERMIEQLLAVI